MSQPIRVSRGEVIGIGKIKIPKTVEFNHEIQLLSFLSIKESEDSFISTCIHLRIDGYGKTEEKADENMVKNVWNFLSRNFSKLSVEDAWDNLRDLFKSDDWSSELWDAYREVQIQMSMSGQQTDPTAELVSRLNRLEKEKKKAERQARDLKEEKDRIELMNKQLLALLIVKRTHWGSVT
jgi:hypothetical protein